ACFRISQRLQSLEAANNAADPPTGHPINDGPSLTGDRIAHHEHVLLWEINVQIAVSVRRIRDVPVANTGVELTGSIERLIRLCGCGYPFEPLPFPWPEDVGRQPQSRVLMGNDGRAGLGQSLVRAGLLGVPVRIEESVNTTAPGQAAHSFHQSIGSGGGSAVDEDHTVSTGLRDDISFSRKSQDEQIVV